MKKYSISFNKLDACNRIIKTLQSHKQFIIQQKTRKRGKGKQNRHSTEKSIKKRSPLHWKKQRLQKQGQLPLPVDLNHHSCESVSVTQEPMNERDSNVRPTEVYKIYHKNNSTISARKTTEDITHQINNSIVKIHISHEIKAHHSLAIENLQKSRSRCIQHHLSMVGCLPSNCLEASSFLFKA